MCVFHRVCATEGKEEKVKTHHKRQNGGKKMRVELESNSLDQSRQLLFISP